MVRERIADDIYVFTSRLYAQVTAGAILTKDGAVLVDTLYFPEETKAIKQFLEDRLKMPVRYVINTHYHADHSQGTYLFPQAQVVGHVLCRELLHTVGRAGLAQAKQDAPELAEVEIVLPDLVLDEGVLQLHLGGKTIEMRHMPGHSPDLLSVYVTNNQVLFASDNMMPVPTIFDGSHNDLVQSLEVMLALELEAIVQGHGEVVLRGEIADVIHSDLSYLQNIHTAVTRVVSNGNSAESLQNIDIESCGKSRVPLNGLVSDLHFANLHKLYAEMNENR
ncbi:MAG TPA: MBL fold metallo-hydrolase [Chloroflexota bacterium]|nr:MBL fold metallo-hydrolase [Chloroflexota bacterium]